MATEVQISWTWIEIEPTDGATQIRDKLISKRIKLEHLSKVVYVIRSSNGFCIDYPLKHSPVLYIGEGRFLQRIRSHFRWIDTLIALPGQMPIEVAICTPRVRNNGFAHREFEAYLLGRFFDLYGSLPLRNKNHENTKYAHVYERAAVTTVFGPGQGKRYKWAIRPLKSNPFFKSNRKAPRVPRDG